MKKSNKTYYLQESIGPRISNSPGRIVKNQTKTLKDKHSHRQNVSSSQSRKEDFEQINRKVQEKLQRSQYSKQGQKERHKQKQIKNIYGQTGSGKHELSVNMSEGFGRVQSRTNPYEQIYNNDLKYFQEYLNSTAKYEFNGVNLNWPYYFTKNQTKLND